MWVLLYIRTLFESRKNRHIYMYMGINTKFRSYLPGWYLDICWKIPIGNGSFDGQNLADQWVFFSHSGDPGGRIFFINSMKWWIVRTVRKGKAYATSWFLIIALAFPLLEWGPGFTGLCIGVFVMGEYQCRFPNYQPKLAVSSKAVTFSPQTNQMKDGYSMILGER